MNSAFGYAFRKEITNLQSASSESARQKLYKVEMLLGAVGWGGMLSLDAFVMRRWSVRFWLQAIFAEN